MASPRTSQTFDVPAELALVALDMEKYSQIPEAKMAAVRSDMDDMLATTLAECGLDELPKLPGSSKDAGDGVILLFPPSVLARLIDPFLERLNAALARYEVQRLASNPTVRLRAGVHVGPLSPPDHRGDAINEVCRLVDSEEARGALSAAKTTGAFLATVLSETVYRRTVHAGRTPGLNRHHFLRAVATVNGKPEFEEPCRVHVPGLTAEAIRPYMADEPSQAPQPTGGAPAAPATGNGASFQFHAAVNDPVIAGRIGTVRNDRRRR